MQLSRAQTDEILDLLNEPAAIDAFLAIAGEQAEARAEWVSMEDDAFYTSGNPWVRAHTDWFKSLLEERRKQCAYSADKTTSIVHYLEPTDFYFYSGENEGAEQRYRSYWLSQQELPISAFLVWQTVFSFSYARREWTARPFLGVTPRGQVHDPERPDDPLLSLPYSRKYDRERALAALNRQTWLWEKLCRAKDLISTLHGRVSSVEIGRYAEAKWSWPETDDIQKQLEEDDLCFELCGLMLYGGVIELEILELKTEYHSDKPPTKRAVGPALARGRYEGPLAKGYPSPASYKKMIETALEQLQENLWEILYPYSDEEHEQLEGELERMRDSLRPPIAELTSEV